MANNWIVSQLFYPEETSTAYIMTKIAEMLSEKGNVNVICGSSSYHSPNLKTNQTIKKGVNIMRIYTPSLNKNNILFRIILFSYFSIGVFFKILFKVKKNDTIILVTNPPTILVIAGFLKQIKKFKLVVILQDIFPENAAVSGIINKSSIIYKISLNVMNYGYRKADKLIACGSDMRQHFIQKGLNPNKIFVVPNWSDVDISDFENGIDRNSYFNLDLTNKVVIEFAGNIGRVQGLEQFIKIYHKSNNPNLVLLIIGEGACKIQLKKYVAQNGISNIYFFNSKPRSEQSKFLNSCDMGLVTLCEGMYGLGVPSKVYNIMSAAKPILYVGDENSEIDNYIKENNIGWSYNWNNENLILNFLNNLESNSNFKAQGLIARNFTQDNFTEETVLRKYKDLLY